MKGAGRASSHRGVGDVSPLKMRTPRSARNWNPPNHGGIADTKRVFTVIWQMRSILRSLWKPISLINHRTSSTEGPMEMRRHVRDPTEVVGRNFFAERSFWMREPVAEMSNKSKRAIRFAFPYRWGMLLRVVFQEQSVIRLSSRYTQSKLRLIRLRICPFIFSRIMQFWKRYVLSVINLQLFTPLACANVERLVTN